MAFVPALLVVLGFVLQGAFAQNASALTGTPCLQTGLETVVTDQQSYPTGSTVHITGTGYGLACDVVVQVTRPDNGIDTETVTTDVSGSFAFDYVIPGPPYATGTYFVDVLGDGAVLAHTSFDDAVQLSQLFANGPPATGTHTFVFTVGDTIYSNGNIDSGQFGRVVVNDGSGANRFTSSCIAATSFNAAPPTYTFASTDPVSTAGQYAYTVQQFPTSACTGTPSGANSKTVNFSLAKARIYSDAALTTLRASFTTGQTAYVVVDGFTPSDNNISTSWILPGGATACSNTSGGDRADSSAAGVLPGTAGGYFQYLPGASGDTWNLTANYDAGNACDAFASGNQGSWKLTVQADATHVTTLATFGVDTTQPTVTINQASGQSDPTTGSPINFTATFSESVTGFTGSDVSFTGSTAGTGGTATGLSATITGGPTVYNVAVSGMATRGNVVVAIPAGSAQDVATNGNTASTSTDNSVTWDRVPATTAPTFSPASPKTNDTLTASTTTSDPDGDNISVAWTWKVNRGGDVCTVQTSSSTSAPAGVRIAGLDLSQNYAPTSCTGAMINPLNPGKGDVVRVEATPNDGLFDGSLQSSNITIVNTTPTVTLSGGNNLSPNEGSPSTYAYSISDADGDPIASVATSCGTGTKTNASNTNTSGSFDCTFADGPASTSVSAQATDSGFGAGAGNNATQSISVQNVAPSVAISGNANVDEGSSYSLTLGAVTDPGTDTVSNYVVHWGDGNTDSYSTNGAKSHTYADGPASRSITVDLVDEDGTFLDRANPLSVTVNNVAPTVTLSALDDLSVSEGSTHTYSYTISDPGQDTVSAVTASCGTNGTRSNDTHTDTSGSFQCTFPDGPNTSIVSASATDSDGDTGEAATQSVTVNNVAPTVHLSTLNDLSVNEGSTHTYSYTITDPGQDTVTGVTTSCSGTGSKVTGSDTFNDTGGSFQCTFADGPNSSMVSASATDSDGATGAADTQSVTVNNVAPTVHLSNLNDLSVNEGSTHTYSYTISDPGQDTVTSVTTSCSGTGSKVGGSDSFTNTSGSFQCSFADGPNTSTVSIAAMDSDGDSGTADTQSVTVNNVAPTVNLSAANDLTIDEGSTRTYTYTISDPGQDTVSAVTASCGANGTKSNDTNTNSAGSFACTFPDGPSSSTVSVSATDSDGDTGNTDSQSVTVDNVAPAVTLSAGNDLSVNEGSTHTYSYSISDPGQDTVSSVTTSCGANGTKSNATNSDTSGSFDCTFPDGPNSSTVSVAATDSDGDTGAADTQSVTVNNVAPTVHLSNLNDLSVNEGSTHTYSYTITDPGQDTVTGVTTSCSGTGSKVTGSDTFNDTSGSFQCSFADGPNSSSVSVAATDSDGDTGPADTQSVSVNNVAPTVTLAAGNELSVNEGSTHTYSYSISDPGQDTVTSVTTSCSGTGDKVSGSDTFNDTSGSFQCSFADGPNSSTVSVAATDSDGATGATVTQSVTVNNVAPTVTLDGPPSVDEGSTHTYTFSVSDPGQDTFSVSTGYPQCGTGGTYVAGSLSTDSSGGSFQCTFPDGPATTELRIRVADSDGASDTDSEAVHVVQVGNVDPAVTAPANQTSDEGDAHSFALGSFSDPGPDSPWAVSVDWGDGSPATTFSAAAPGSLGSNTHTYADGPATRTVTVTVTDANGGSGSATFQVGVNNIAPTVALSGGNDLSVNEGSTHTYSYTISDPGTDTVASVTTSCGANGTKSNDTNTNSTGSFDCTFPNGPAGSAVSVSATDSDGDTGNTDTQTVTVNNVAPGTPNLVSPVDGAVTNDDTPAFDWSSVSDAGNDTVTYAIQADNNGCAFASPEVDVSGLATSDFTPVTSLPAGTYCWRVRATDSDGANSGYSMTRTVTIDVTRPTVTIDQATGQSDPTNASPIHFTAVFSEPVSGFSGSDVTIAGSAGGSKTVLVTDSGDQMTFDVAVSGMADGTIVASIGANGAQDAAGNGNVASSSSDNSVLYDGTAPTLTVNQASGQSDPTSTSPIHFTASFSEPVTGFQNGDVTIGGTAGGSKSASVTNPSNDGRTYDVAVSGMTTSGTVTVSVDGNKAQDAAGNGNAAATSTDNTVTWAAQVQNTPPAVTITSPAFGSLYAKGSANVSLSASFTDPDAGQTHTCSINWDDGLTTTPAVNEAARTCGQAHTFTAAGVYTIVVSICDSVGGCGSAEVWVVVYDPSAGFVTGGGWINVAPGSYPANPLLGGRANFGFNAKYQNGAKPPSGQTEFDFDVGNFNFHSETYDWLVVSGFKAQFHGTGSVNGVPGYDFRLTGYDGQVTGGGGLDKFRIKVTRNGQTVFDNRMGVPDDPDVADPQVIAGGSIVIHR